LLRTASVSFCRFVDDYFLFADSTSSAQRALVQLSEILLTNEGLTLARAKTRVMSQSEFRKSSPLADAGTAEIVNEIGVPAIRAKTTRQSARLLALAEEAGLRVNTCRVPAMRGGVATIDVPGGWRSRANWPEILVDYRPGASIRVAPHV